MTLYERRLRLPRRSNSGPRSVDKRMVENSHVYLHEILVYTIKYIIRQGNLRDNFFAIFVDRTRD